MDRNDAPAITLSGWSAAMGITLATASTDEVVGDIQIGDVHKQSFGLVHGGVYCGFIESLASIGALLVAKDRGQAGVVGLENSTSFLHAVSSGRIRGTAKPITRGASTQVWEVVVRDEGDRIVAVGRVRLLCLDET
jgi:1,4-dihydroxy-2-naphthoyl-CoA hydrolase